MRMDLILICLRARARGLEPQFRLARLTDRFLSAPRSGPARRRSGHIYLLALLPIAARTTAPCVRVCVCVEI